ncbi:hypothetical protein CsSME_00041888 [Camellia sinensis var. sinensis]
MEGGVDTDTQKMLCTEVMKGQWKEVLNMYSEKLNKQELTIELLLMKITRSGGTTLHMAIYEGNYNSLKKLVTLIETCDQQRKGSAAAAADEEDEEERGKGRDWKEELADDKGNTPLHLAAKMGQDHMCYAIATSTSTKLSRLLSCRNNDGETPIFVAALHGKTQAFLALCYVCCTQAGMWDNPQIYQYGRRPKDGNTVLHCAIKGEYFELAYQIIERFPEFVSGADERGYVPLDILASKRFSFKSSSGLTWLQKLIYKGVPADKPRPVDDFRPFNDDDAGKHRKPEGTDVENPSPSAQTKYRHRFLSKSRRCIEYLYLSMGFLPKGIRHLLPKHIVEMKEKHLWAIKIEKRLMKTATYYEYLHGGFKPASGYETNLNKLLPIPGESNSDIYHDNPTQTDTSSPSLCGSITLSFPDIKQGIDVARILNTVTNSLVSSEKTTQKNQKPKETLILLAAKSGITEIVEDILYTFPAAIHDVNSEGKNLILLTVENRQPQIYQSLIKIIDAQTIKDLFLGLDDEGNSALHLAAVLKTYQPWLAPNAILQMQWEIKWFEYIKEKMPKHLLGHQNNEGKTAEEIFLETHSELVKNDIEWLMKTSDSCTIVAALIATVAFATSVSVPGGTKSRGEPVLEGEPMFEVFSISSLGALCFSLTAVVMFLAILTSRHQAIDFGRSLPTKLLIGLTALFISIASVLVSFCGGHFFVLKNVLKDAKVAEYVVAVIPVLVFAIAQFPLYFKLILATIKKVPERGFMVTIGGEDRGVPVKAEASPNLRITTN